MDAVSDTLDQLSVTKLTTQVLTVNGQLVG